MDNSSKLSRKKIWVLLFIATAITGAVLIFWTLKSRETTGSLEDAYLVESEIVAEDQGEAGPGDGIFKEYLSKKIPPGMKAVNLPVSFFGDFSELKQGDRVDIISTYYDRETGMLDSEKIISDREIIALETGGGPGMGKMMSLGGSIIPDDITVPGTAADMRNIMVMTFFLRDDETLKSFTALEAGILYLALCPDDSGTGRSN